MYKNIMVPMDGSKLAEAVLPHVAAIAQACSPTTVTFIRVNEPLPIVMQESPLSDDNVKDMEKKNKSFAEQYLDDLAQRVKYNGVKVKTIVLDGNPANAIANYADKNNADLIVIATHGRSGPSRWVWGGTADHILRSTCTPVLMVRVPGCGTAV